MATQKLYAGAKLREVRQRMGLTQKAFAGKLGVSLPYLNQMENNNRPVSTAVVLALASEFGFDVTELAAGDAERLVTDLHEALSDPDVCLLYPRRPYPKDALIPKKSIANILGNMRKLRTADETLYLRAASINIFNGLLSLTFSCDGTHYMSWRDFLEKDMRFWLGSAA